MVMLRWKATALSCSRPVVPESSSSYITSTCDHPCITKKLATAFAFFNFKKRKRKHYYHDIVIVYCLLLIIVPAGHH